MFLFQRNFFGTWYPLQQFTLKPGESIYKIIFGKELFLVKLLNKNEIVNTCCQKSVIVILLYVGTRCCLS